MDREADVREFVHRVVNSADIYKLRAILELLDEDYFTPDEIAEIKEMRESTDGVNWRDVRRDV
jgi:hypothetical protein